MEQNFLYYGDNLDILQRYIKDESVDLIYLDPPFNSNATYNVLFAEQDGTRAAAQIKAFEDTWQWDQGAAKAYMEAIEIGGRVAQAMVGFRNILGDTNMLAYLSMMAPRLNELHRVLKASGSIYLHCDPTASHYLKMLMDAVFEPRNFRADIRWKRTSAHGNATMNYAFVSDQLLFYTKDSQWTWNQLYQPYNAEYLDSHYGQSDPDGRRFTTRDLTASMQRASSGQLYAWKGVRPVVTRCWSFTIDKMKEFEAQGLLVYGKSGVPRLKLYLDQQPGTPMSDIWEDIPPINSQAQERLGYPTQKPEALLERIINTSSNEDDVVLDPFCGCGTAIAAAQKLKRRWIGIDITQLAISLIKHRLKHAFADVNEPLEYDVIGEPTTAPDAKVLADEEPFQFQAWALGLVGARTSTSSKKGADKGIDGRLYFHDEEGGKTKQIIFSVKGGHIGNAVRDLRGVIEREKAAIGVLLTMDKASKAMRSEAASAGFYESMGWGKFPRIQILTIEELLEGAEVKYPPTRANVTLKKAAKAVSAAEEPKRLF